MTQGMEDREEQRYHLLWRFARDIMLLVKPDGAIVDANDAAVRAYGYPREELLSLSIFDLRASDDPSFVTEQMRRADSVGVQFETVHRRKDGSLFPVEVNSCGTLIDGEPHLFSVIRDTTSRRESERALRESEERFRSLFSRMSEGFALHEIICDGQGIPLDYRFLELNPAFERLTGLKADETIGRTVREAIPGIEERWIETYGKVALTGESIRFQSLAAPLGRDYDVVAFSPVKGQFATLFLDVTEQTNMRRQIETERDALEAIMESTSACIVYLDREFTILMANSAYVRSSGHTREELIGGNHFGLFPNEGNQAIFERVRDTGEVAEYQAKPFEYEDQPWRGVTYWDWTLTPVQEPSGSVSALILSLVDVTENIRARQFGEALNGINAAINSTLDFGEVMHRALSESIRAVGAQSGMIRLREGDNWVVRYALGGYEDIVDVPIPDDELPLTSLAARTREPVVMEDALDDPRISREAAERYHLRSVIVIPLLVRDEVMGTLSLHRSMPVRFSRDQVDFTTKLGASISLSLENARLFGQLQESLHHEQRTVEMLQKALVPAPLTIPEGYEIASAYIPAYAGDEIGGDFYDVFRLPDGRFGIVIGDVSGKGIPAAALAASTRSSVRALTYCTASPGEALSKANAALYSEEAFASFVTVFLAVLDPATGRIRYSCAGHPPPMVCQAPGEIELLSAGSFPIGLSPDELYGEYECTLAPGGRLLMYTDGITEARHDAEMLGTERVTELLIDCTGSSAEEILAKTLGSARDWAGGSLRDDTAVIVISRAD